MRRLTQLLIGSACLVAASACNNDSTSPTVNIYGTYSLRTINGSSLPYQFTASNGQVVTLTNDILTLNPDGTYTDQSYLTSFQGTNVSTESGTWSSNNGAISFYDITDGGLTYGGSLSGSVLTEIDTQDGLTEVFQKQ